MMTNPQDGFNNRNKMPLQVVRVDQALSYNGFIKEKDIKFKRKFNINRAVQCEDSSNGSQGSTIHHEDKKGQQSMIDRIKQIQQKSVELIGTSIDGSISLGNSVKSKRNETLSPKD